MAYELVRVDTCFAFLSKVSDFPEPAMPLTTAVHSADILIIIC